MKLHTALVAVLVGVTVLFGALPAMAAPISVPNFSFEDPDVADSFTGSVIPGWTFSTSAPGFGAAEVLDPVNAQYPGTAGPNTPLPGTAQGGQLGDINTFSGGFAGTFALTSGGLATVADSTTYTLIVALGDRNTGTPFFSTDIQLLVNGSVVANSSATAAQIPDGTFADFSTAFTTGPGDPLSGGSLAIRLQGVSNAFVVRVSDFDNVRLDGSAAVVVPPAVPEPTSLLLLSTGVVAAGVNRWRKRRRATLIL